MIVTSKGSQTHYFSTEVTESGGKKQWKNMSEPLPYVPRNNTAGKINILYHSDFTPYHFINSANDYHILFKITPFSHQKDCQGKKH